MLFNIFGSLTSGLIRLAITAATILLVYFFILKPILATTENVTGATGDGQVQRVLDSVSEALGGQGAEAVKRQIENQLRGVDSTNTAADKRTARRLLRCIENSGSNADRMRRCAKRFAP